MEGALMKIDISETAKHIKTAVYETDKRILALIGAAAGSFAIYQTLEAISSAGKTEIGWLKKMHDAVRVCWNRGAMIKCRHFLLDPKAYIVNYGSFGVVPKAVLQYKWKLQEEMESCPDQWFYLKMKEKWIESTKRVAEAVGCDPKDLVFTHNVTEAINCVIKSINFTENDYILLTNHTYASVRNIAEVYMKKAGGHVITLDIPFPIESEEKIFEMYEKVLHENKKIKFAVIDHITSSSAILMPVERLINLVKKYDVLCLVDGAHAPGQIPLNIDQLGADFYGGNLHKWHFTPRGCGFLWVNPTSKEVITPSLVSHTYKGDFNTRFYFQGTDDYTNYLTAGYAVSEYYPSIGGLEHILQTNVPMRKWAVKLFRETWNTESPGIPSTMKAPFMEIVKMPEGIIKYYGATKQGGNNCKVDLMKGYNVYMMVSAVNGALWCRVSWQICSTKAEYYKAAQAVKDLERKLVNKTNRDDSTETDF